VASRGGLIFARYDAKSFGAMAKAYSPRLFADLCARIADGATLPQACRAEGVTACSIVFRWMGKYPKAAEMYARAREARAELHAEEIIAISDDSSNDWMQIEGKNVIDHEHIQRSKLRVDTRRWLLSKLVPKQYGDKMQVGGDPAGSPVVVEIMRFSKDDKDPPSE